MLPPRFLAIALGMSLPLLVHSPKATGQTLASEIALEATFGATPEPALESLSPLGVPATEDIPEEILRTEIITEARSPLTGEPLSAAEYAQLQDELAAPAGGTLAGENLSRLYFLLEIRRALKPILPFIK